MKQCDSLLRTVFWFCLSFLLLRRWKLIFRFDLFSVSLNMLHISTLTDSTTIKEFKHLQTSNFSECKAAIPNVFRQCWSESWFLLSPRWSILEQDTEPRLLSVTNMHDSCTTKRIKTTCDNQPYTSSGCPLLRSFHQRVVPTFLVWLKLQLITARPLSWFRIRDHIHKDS